MLARLLANNGGWLHRSALIDAGWTKHRILTRRRAEGIDLVRRQWLMHPDAAADVREAARVGGVVSCVSALAHYELWIPPGLDDRRPHLRLPGNFPLSGEGCVNHRTAPVVRADARSLWDSVENVLMCVSACLPADQAYAVWESALGRRLVTSAQLRRIPWPSAHARRLATEASPASDSGIESTFVWRCRRAGMRVAQQVMIAGQRVDGLIGKRLVVQLDGFAFHKDAAQRRRDIRHDRELVALGYTVLRFDYVDVMHEWPRVEREIRRAISVGLAD